MLCICSHTEGCYFTLDQRNVFVFSRWQEEEQSSGPVSSFLDSWESIIAYSHCRPCSTAIAISCCRCSPVHVHSARATSFTKNSVPFLCPRFIAHIFMIATNCCRISKSNFSAHKSFQTPEEDKSSTWMILRTLQKRRMIASLFFSMARGAGINFSCRLRVGLKF